MAVTGRCKGSDFLLHLLALAVYLALSYGLYTPPAGIRSATYFGTTTDPLIYIWFLNWPIFALHHHLSLFHTDYVFYPTGLNLAWKTNVISLSLLLWPLTSTLGPFAVFNGLMIATPALAAWGAYLALFELVADTVAAFAGGVIFGFSSYMLAQMTCHLNLSFVFAVPFCLWLVIAAVKYSWSRKKLALWLGMALAFEFGVSQEIYASLVIFGALAVLTVYKLVPATRASLARLSPGMAGGLALSVVFLSPLILLMLQNYGSSVNLARPDKFSTDLFGLILPTPVDWLGGRWLEPVTRLLSGNYGEEGDYLGLPLIVLLACLGWRHRHRPAYRAPAAFILLAVVLSLGPYVHVVGFQVSTAPWFLVFGLPFLKDMLPLRFMLYAWLAIAVLLSTWLAGPGDKRRRYAVLTACLIFLVPDRSYDRNWTPLNPPKMLTDGSLPLGSKIMILPEYAAELGYQVASGMRYRLVAQGYMSPAVPKPFQNWPLYRPIFGGEPQYLARVDPVMFSAFLAAYGVQNVIVMGNASDFAAPATQSGELAEILAKAGWVQARAGADARLYRPLRPPVMPRATQIEAYWNQPSPDEMRRAIRAETEWVRCIRLFGHLTGLNPEPLLVAYVRWSKPPLRPAAIVPGGVF